MRVAILQPNYIPWKGYFDLIDSVDCFVLLDTVQYTVGDWRNRNRIKTAEGVQWLTIPVDRRTCGKNCRIHEVEVKDPDWGEVHWRRLERSYTQAPAFAESAPVILEFFREISSRRIADIDAHLIGRLCAFLEIRTPLVRASELEDVPDRNGRLFSLCEQLGASEYVSGPAAKAYLDETGFEERRIRLSYFEYENFPEYEQIHPPFCHGVTVLDPIFHVGTSARQLVVREGRSRGSQPQPHS